MGFHDEVEPTCGSWQELVSELVAMDSEGWVFRGLSNYDYQLLSKLERVLHDAGIYFTDWRHRESSAIAFFKERARHYLSDLPDDWDLLSWLALMQHYGAPTRLTDWTVSPFVACYFAYESVRASSKEGDAALWMLNAAKINNRLRVPTSIADHDKRWVKTRMYEEGGIIDSRFDDKLISKEKARFYSKLLREVIQGEVHWLLPLPILLPDRRMAAQQACFICSGHLFLPGERSIVEELMSEEGWNKVAGWLDGNPYIDGKVKHAAVDYKPYWYGEPTEGPIDSLPLQPHLVVRKVRLPHEWRTEALKSLAEMNITGNSLFPGLDGVGRATEVYMQTLAPSSMREYLGLETPERQWRQ